MGANAYSSGGGGRAFVSRHMTLALSGRWLRHARQAVRISLLFSGGRSRLTLMMAWRMCAWKTVAQQTGGGLPNGAIRGSPRSARPVLAYLPSLPSSLRRGAWSPEWPRHHIQGTRVRSNTRKGGNEETCVWSCLKISPRLFFRIFLQSWLAPKAKLGQGHDGRKQRAGQKVVL